MLQANLTATFMVIWPAILSKRQLFVYNLEIITAVCLLFRSCVAVTGCPGQQDLEFTINSKHAGPSSMYILKMNGEVQVVESAFKVKNTNLKFKVYFLKKLNVNFRILECVEA